MRVSVPKRTGLESYCTVLDSGRCISFFWGRIQTIWTVAVATITTVQL